MTTKHLQLILFVSMVFLTSLARAQDTFGFNSQQNQNVAQGSAQVLSADAFSNLVNSSSNAIQSSIKETAAQLIAKLSGGTPSSGGGGTAPTAPPQGAPAAGTPTTPTPPSTGASQPNASTPTQPGAAPQTPSGSQPYTGFKGPQQPPNAPQNKTTSPPPSGWQIQY